MEEWFHDWNDKKEVNDARPLIGEALKMVQSLFQERRRAMVIAYPRCME